MHFTANNAGPVRQLSCDIEPGTVIVFEGRNGSGKSIMLDSIDHTLRGVKSGATPTDGSQRGRVSIGGATLSIGKTVRATGTAEVETIEGSVTLDSIVQPPIKDAEAADRYRVKQLLRLLGASPSMAELEQIAGADAWAQIAKDVDTKDIVEAVAKLKRNAETRARNHEDVVTTVGSHITQLAVDVAEVDFARSANSDQCAEDYQAAVKCLAELEAQRRVYEMAVASKDIAEKELAAMPPTVHVPHVQLLVSREHSTLEELDLKMSELVERKSVIETEMKVTEEKRIGSTVRLGQLKESISQAMASADRITTLTKALELPDNPMDIDIEAAGDDVDETRDNHAYVAVVANGLWRREQLAGLHERRDEATDAAQQFREIAKAMTQSLTDAICTVTQRIRVNSDERLVVATIRDNDQLFSTLSTGERYMEVIGMMVDALAQAEQRQAIVMISQTGWEALDDYNRSLVAQAVACTPVSIVTARCTESPTVVAKQFAAAEITG